MQLDDSYASVLLFLWPVDKNTLVKILSRLVIIQYKNIILMNFELMGIIRFLVMESERY